MILHSPLIFDPTRMHRLLHPLFGFLASLNRQELARQVAYLKAENRILRARLPRRPPRTCARMYSYPRLMPPVI